MDEKMLRSLKTFSLLFLLVTFSCGKSKDTSSLNEDLGAPYNGESCPKDCASLFNDSENDKEDPSLILKKIPSPCYHALRYCTPKKDEVVSVPNEDVGVTCRRKAPPQLRNLFASYYATLPIPLLANKLNENRDSKKRDLSKLMNLMIKESSGNPTAVSDMKGNGSYQSFSSFFSLNKSRGNLSLSHFVNIELLERLLYQSNVRVTKQTNFGLAQLSADRLLMPNWGGQYLREKIAMIKEISAPDFIKWCLTRTYFNDEFLDLVNYFNTKIKRCTVGVSTIEAIRCFGRTLNFCPRMAIELALLQPTKYFEVKNPAPICSEIFN